MSRNTISIKCLLTYPSKAFPPSSVSIETQPETIDIGINLFVVYRESVNLIGYITRRLSADSLQL